MSKNTKTFIRLIIFLIILMITIFVLSDLAIINRRDSYNFEPFYELSDNSVEAVFVGPSTCFCGISPTRLYEKSGISAYVFGSSNQSMMSSYLWAKESYRTQKYKVLFVESGSLLFPYGEPKRNVEALYSMGKSPVYFEFAYNHKLKGLGVLLPVFLYHDFWKEIRDYDFAKYPNPSTVMMRGFSPLGSRRDIPEDCLLVDSQNTSDFEFNTEYLDKTVEFCNDNDIKMVLFKTTLVHNDQWSSEWHNSVMKYANEHNIDFIDFNEDYYFNEANLVFNEDIAEDGYHLNANGAHKVTDWVGEYLSQCEDLEFSYNNFEDYYTEEQIEEYYRTIEEVSR